MTEETGDILCVLYWNTAKFSNKLIFSSTTEAWNFALQKGEKYFNTRTHTDSFPKETDNAPYFHPPHSLLPAILGLEEIQKCYRNPSTTNLYGLMTQFQMQKQFTVLIFLFIPNFNEFTFVFSYHSTLKTIELHHPEGSIRIEGTRLLPGALNLHWKHEV